MENLWWLAIALLFLLAYLGLIIPALPDAPFVLAGFGVYHFFIDDTPLKGGFWITAIIVVLVLFLVDYLASGLAVKKYGGTPWSIVAAVLGLITFPLFLGPLGILIGPFVLVFLLEWFLKKSWQEALKIGYSTLIGFMGGIAVKFLIITAMIVWFCVTIWV